MRTRVNRRSLLTVLVMASSLNWTALSTSISGVGLSTQDPADGRPVGKMPRRASVSECSSTQQDTARCDEPREAFGGLPLMFESNQGQAEGGANFLARGDGYSLFLRPTESVLSFWNYSPASHSTERSMADMRSSVLRTKLIGASAASSIIGVDELPGKSNYFIGNDSTRWRTNVSNYARVRCQDVYPGIEMIYYGTQRRLEYDFKVAPGADPGRIRISFEGAQSIRIDDQGDLLLDTPAGQIREHKPMLYQEVDGSKTEIAGRYVLEGRNR
ncbi:MAG TPA: hypothetical protein VKF81_12720, partial [Blastocatellia bacterium]|nr:hypothetical protein [Blastocatellia bacterium]